MYIPIEDWIHQTYAFIHQFNVSITALIAMGVIFCLALLFAVREAASWFFKVDDVKRDVRKLHKLTLDLEGEIRSLHALIELAQAKKTPNVLPNPPVQPPESNFPISH